MGGGRGIWASDVVSKGSWRRVDEQRGRVLADIRLLEIDGPSDLNYRKYLYILGKDQPRHSEDVGAWTRDYRERLHARLVDIELEAEQQRERSRAGDSTITGRIRLQLRSRGTQVVLAILHKTEARLRIEQFQSQFDALDKRLDRIETTHENMRRNSGKSPITEDSRADAFRQGSG